MSQQKISITETSNPITVNIDQCSPEQILDLLLLVDNELFSTHSSPLALLNSNKHSQNLIAQCTKQMAPLVQSVLFDGDQGSTVAFSGCGTSGRLSYFCAKSYNDCLTRIRGHLNDASNNKNQQVELFKYLLAGGHIALVKAVESAEDSAITAIQDFKDLVGETPENKVVYVGITCGMSAPYIAGQLYHTMQNKNNENLSSILLGFNPVELSRQTPIENWPVVTSEPVSFYQICQQMDQLAQEQDSRFIILNPVVNPEGITGSTRMKGGSATKFLLDTMFASAVVNQFNNNVPTSEVIYRLLNGFQQTVLHTYQFSNQHTEIANLIQRAAFSLRNGGSIYYLGSGNAGMIGFIDASECGPTYGAKVTDVQGFIANGWKSVFGHRYDSIQPRMEDSILIDSADFETRVLPNLTEFDTVLFLDIDSDSVNEVYATEKRDLLSLAQKIQSHNSNTFVSYISVSAVEPEHACMYPVSSPANSSVKHKNVPIEGIPVVNVRVPYMSLVPGLDGFAELSLKLVLNAITTGAHVLKGTVFGNRMINLRVSNNKLFYRAIGIVSNIVHVDEETARKCLLKAIYRSDSIEEFEQQAISKHIEVAVKTDKVVPVAMLLSSNPSITVEKALEILQQEPVIRNAIAKLSN